MTGGPAEPQEVHLSPGHQRRVEESQAKYIRSVPKHHSQSEIEPIDGWPAFTYHLAPTYDFMQELLSHGAFVEVLSPESLRKEIKDTAAAMTKIYEKK